MMLVRLFRSQVSPPLRRIEKNQRGIGDGVLHEVPGSNARINTHDDRRSVKGVQN